MIGVMLLGITSCYVPTFKKPIQMYEVNLDFYESGVGKVNLNIKDDHVKVGEWINKDDVFFIGLDQAPKLLKCFSQKTWDERIVPKIKEGARAYRDYKD